MLKACDYSFISILFQLQHCYPHFRLLQNYTEVDYGFVPCTELQVDYLRRLRCEKENVAGVYGLCKAVEIGKVLFTYFPKVTRAKRRVVKGKPGIHVYCGIAKKPESLSSASALENNTADRFESWSDFCERFWFPGWFKSGCNSSHVEFTRVLPLLCDKKKVLQEIIVSNVWTFDVKVMGISVPKEAVGQLKLSPEKKIVNLFRIVSNSKICSGFAMHGEVLDERSLPGKHDWSSGEHGSEKTRVTSQHCNRLCFTAISSQYATCHQCSQFRHLNWRKVSKPREVNEDQESDARNVRKREDLMTRKEQKSLKRKKEEE